MRGLALVEHLHFEAVDAAVRCARIVAADASPARARQWAVAYETLHNLAYEVAADMAKEMTS